MKKLDDVDYDTIVFLINKEICSLDKKIANVPYLSVKKSYETEKTHYKYLLDKINFLKGE